MSPAFIRGPRSCGVARRSGEDCSAPGWVAQKSSVTKKSTESRESSSERVNDEGRAGRATLTSSFVPRLEQQAMAIL